MWSLEPITMKQPVTVLEVDLSHSGHAADTLRLLSAYSADPMGGGQTLSETAMRDVIPGLRAHPTTMVFLAYAGDEAVGMAICFLGFSTFAARRSLHIMDFYVTPVHRGGGIGKALLEAVADRARAIDCCRLTLEVQERNQHARRIYEAAGFVRAVYAPNAGGSLCLHKAL